MMNDCLKAIGRRLQRRTSNVNTTPFSKTTGLEPDCRARDYLFYWQLWHHNWDDRDIEMLFTLADPSGKDIVEAGCGDGRITIALAHSCRSITGIDIDERLIEAARKRVAADNGLRNRRTANFAVMNIEDLKFPDASADIILLPWMLHMCSKPQLALQQSLRVLRPGGCVVIIALLSPNDYDSVIGRFTGEQASIDPAATYEAPIELVFGKNNVVLARQDFFSYRFASLEIAREAFKFALSQWHGYQLSDEEIELLHESLSGACEQKHIELNFPAMIYKIVKPEL